MDIEIKTSLQTERLGNRLWVLLSPFKFSVDSKSYTVPAGFVTDGASAPRWLWSLCSPIAGPFGEAAVAHDYFYSRQGPDVTQQYADRVLYEIGRHRDAYEIIARLVKAVVQITGRKYFKVKKDKLKEGGCYDYDEAQKIVDMLIQLNAGT